MSDVTITVRANGPYKIVGPVRIVDPEGRELDVPHVHDEPAVGRGREA